MPDSQQAANDIATAARQRIFDVLGAVDLTEAEHDYVCSAAWEGDTDELVSIPAKVRADEQTTPAERAVAAGFEFGDVTDESKARLVAQLRREQPKVDRAGWPGMPIGFVPLREGPTMRAMVADGAVEMVTVTKASKVTRGELSHYTYLRLTDRQPAKG
jgi:hypothetical protein